MRLIAKPLYALSCLLTVSQIQAQDIVYFSSDGSAVSNTRITNVTDTKAVLTVIRDGNKREFTFGRSRIALAFSKTGNFLLMSELAQDTVQARHQLQTFQTAPPRSVNRDYLIKTAPLSVIAAHISYENEEVVNYITMNGNAASINKNELTAILYQNGRHLLTIPAGEAAPLLAKIRSSLNDSSYVITPEPSLSQTASLPSITQRDSLMQSNQARVEHTTGIEMSLVDSVDIDSHSPALSNEEKKIYRRKSLMRVDEFVSYLSIITDQNIDSDEKDRAIEEAARLFLPESTIEVSSTKRPGSRRYSVRLYLTRLKLLPYLSTRINWVQTQFIRDLTPNQDGTYSGTVAGQQTFTGYGNDGKAAYSDLTPKHVRIRLDHYQKSVQDKEPAKWRILLGNIRIETE